MKNAFERVVEMMKTIEEQESDGWTAWGKLTDELRGIIESEYPAEVLSILESSWDGSRGEVVKTFRGKTGYFKTIFGRQTREWVFQKNAEVGVPKSTQYAYEICSIMNTWVNYEQTLESVRASLEEKSND